NASSQPSVTSSVVGATGSRTKEDPAWGYAEEIRTEDGKTWIKCKLYGHLIKGSGIHRVKKNLAGERGNVAACKAVTHDVRARFKALLASSGKRKPAEKDNDVASGEQDSTSVVRQVTSAPSQPNFFAPRTTPGAQPGIRSALAGRDAKKNADLIVAKWFYHAKLPFNAAHSEFYQMSYDAVAAIGPGYKIVRPGATRFATSFICLRSIYEHRSLLEQLVTSNFFASHKLGKSAEGKHIKSIVLDNNFWQECLVMVKLTIPIVKLLRIVDSDEQPSLGYVHDGMIRIKKTIKNTFLGNGAGADVYMRLIDARWEKHLQRNIYGVAYFLNPVFQYTEEGRAERGVQGCLIDFLETDGLCSDVNEAIQEIRLYRDRLGSFGKKSAIACATTLPPGNQL
ncbi:unnamed protein product, partial [Linum tenue]